MDDRTSPLGPREGKCYWCQADANSLEDIVPRWLDKVLVPPRGLVAGYRTLRTTIDGRSRSTTVQRWATKRIASRSVCEACNNGWMSRLEAAAKPLLAPMILGEATTLSLDGQLQVARWATMKAGATDSRPGREHEGLGSEAVRAAIYDRGEVPIDMLVRLAAFDEPFTVLVTTPFGVGLGRSGGYLAQWCTTFVFGHLVVQVAARTGSSRPGVLEQFPEGRHDGYSFTSWPPMPTGASWPPREVLDRDRLTRFTTELVPGAELPVDLFTDPGVCSCGVDHGVVTREIPIPPRSPADLGLTWAKSQRSSGGSAR